jgi:hypothetical protein
MTVDETNEKTNLAASAQIIAFPGPKRAARGLSIQRPVVPHSLPIKKEPVTVHGSSWYHEVAVLEAEMLPKR